MQEQYSFRSARTGRAGKVFLDRRGRFVALVATAGKVIHVRRWRDALAARMHVQHVVSGVTSI